MAVESKRREAAPAATAPSSTAAPTFGAAAARLRVNGYTPVSALTPDTKLPDFAISEHPAAVAMPGGEALIALLLAPIEDTELTKRIERLLTDRGVMAGPVRVGSDHARLWPLRSDPNQVAVAASALDGAVRLESSWRGPGAGVRGSVLPLDGAWPNGTLLETSYDRLPAISADEAVALLTNLDRLRHSLKEERRPPPKPTRAGWIGR